MSKIKVKFDFKKFDKAFIDFINNLNTYNILYGGSGAGKSYFLARFLTFWCLMNPQLKVLVVRDVGTTLDDTIIKEFLSAISDFNGLARYSVSKKKDKHIVFANGAIIYFKGLDDVDKLKGIDANIVFVEEADQIIPQAFEELERRLRNIKSGGEIKYFLLFNPVSEESWLFERFFNNESVSKVDDKKLNKKMVTFLNNIKNLPFSYIENLLNLEKSNPEMFKVYAKGEFGVIGERVFNNNFFVKDLDIDELLAKGFKRAGGMDLGYSNDETAILDCYINSKTKEIYVANEFYKTHSNENEVYQWLLANNMQRLSITTDTNEPRFIDNLIKLGVRGFKKAYKPADSVDFMIYTLQSYKIYCSTNSKNTYKELNNYIYKLNRKTGKYSNERVSNIKGSDGDHAISALRYVLQDFTNIRDLNLKSANIYKLANKI